MPVDWTDMPLSLHEGRVSSWRVNRIAVVGPGIVGMPMAALLAHARIREGGDTPAHVVVIQRNSPTSGWKVPAINEGRSPIGGVEPALDEVVRDAVAQGLLSASHDYAALADADVVLVSVQTDRRGNEPDYGPLFEALDGIAAALATRPAGNIPLVIFESTLAPSSMTTVIREHFARHGLVEGRDVLLGNSPNRVMPGRLVERVVLPALTTAKPGHSAAVIAPVAGQLVRPPGAELPLPGQRVQAGQLLALLRPGFSEAAAKFADSEGEFARARAELDQAETAYQRTRLLAEQQAIGLLERQARRFAAAALEALLADLVARRQGSREKPCQDQQGEPRVLGPQAAQPAGKPAVRRQGVIDQAGHAQ